MRLIAWVVWALVQPVFKYRKNPPARLFAIEHWAWHRSRHGMLRYCWPWVGRFRRHVVRGVAYPMEPTFTVYGADDWQVVELLMGGRTYA
jgi:hypothetical protein